MAHYIIKKDGAVVHRIVSNVEPSAPDWASVEAVSDVSEHTVDPSVLTDDEAESIGVPR
jgi:hypothetical protein